MNKYLNPILSFINITVEPLNFMSFLKGSHTFASHGLEIRPLLVQIFQLSLDLDGGVGLSECHELHRDLVHLGETHLVGFQVGLEVVELLLHHLNLFQVVAYILIT